MKLMKRTLFSGANLKRRTLLQAACLFPIAAALRAQSPLQPLALRLIRRAGFQELMGKNKCVISDLYKSNPTFPITDLGYKLSNALELPMRNNLPDISAIPIGVYEGRVRTDGALGWRIELSGTKERKNIQIHVGNTPVDTIGCILPGMGNSTDANCSVAGSVAAMQVLKDAYGSDNGRPVMLRIQQA